MSPDKPRIALWFRYGPAEHTELFHAMPDIVEELARHCEVHYYGLKSLKPIPPRIAGNAHIHHLPFVVDRTRHRDKVWKTMLWVLCLPFVALRCRMAGIRAVYIDEAVPLTAPIARLFFGKAVAFTVGDFFWDIYLGNSRFLMPFVGLMRAVDLWGWKRLRLIFTRAKATREYLTERGVSFDMVRPVYDPCDFAAYHPDDHSRARAQWGYKPDDVVVVHHGILHPNKGNDRILRALASVRHELPNLRFLLVGDGPEKMSLEKLATDLGIRDIVRFTGWLPALSDVNEALNAADIGLVMRIGQRSDDFHMTGALVHSMACGLPILAARLAGISEVVREDDAGLLFHPADMDEFKRKLISLARDPEMRRRMGCRSHALAKELFAIDKVTQATVQPLLELAGVEASSSPLVNR